MSFTFSTRDLQSSLAYYPLPAPKMSSRSQTSPRTPKLRASCDCCAASKVKCSQDRPSCSRCASNGTICIYGISRKNGRPGRGRKRARDTPPPQERAASLDGRRSESFRLVAEPLLPDLPEFDLPSWPSTPEWPATPEFQDESMPDLYASDSSSMDGIMPVDPLPFESEQTTEPELIFTNPFAKKGGLNLEFSLPPGFQSLKNFVEGDDGNGSYTLLNQPNDFFIPMATPPVSPKGSSSFFEAF
ncbi:hypothetical protein K491DRAFT_686474 [Lophiostoma macrostomum CBS 122681]|uniref:Zn(2)-C6 fungal-type domain-containing protein n=1 Tax=Lophiostoma macrostomum CBS 122681 TaxID=1314788 RepID=A0A6A6TVE9_9PLEO|nr:hypothetical protein K491DRAFT_686474 [Lophiostoma macrostomum CBS 122681]